MHGQSLRAKDRNLSTELLEEEEEEYTPSASMCNTGINTPHWWALCPHPGSWMPHTLHPCCVQSHGTDKAALWRLESSVWYLSNHLPVAKLSTYCTCCKLSQTRTLLCFHPQKHAAVRNSLNRTPSCTKNKEEREPSTDLNRDKPLAYTQACQPSHIWPGHSIRCICLYLYGIWSSLVTMKTYLKYLSDNKYRKY